MKPKNQVNFASLHTSKSIIGKIASCFSSQKNIHDVAGLYYLFEYSVRFELTMMCYERRIKKYFFKGLHTRIIQ